MLEQLLSPTNACKDRLNSRVNPAWLSPPSQSMHHRHSHAVRTGLRLGSAAVMLAGSIELAPTALAGAFLAMTLAVQNGRWPCFNFRWVLAGAVM